MCVTKSRRDSLNLRLDLARDLSALTREFIRLCEDERCLDAFNAAILQAQRVIMESILSDVNAVSSTNKQH